MHDPKEPNQKDVRRSNSSKLADFGLIYENLGSARPNLKLETWSNSQQISSELQINVSAVGTRARAWNVIAFPATAFRYTSPPKSIRIKSLHIDAQAENSVTSNRINPSQGASPCLLFVFAQIFDLPLAPIVSFNNLEPSLNLTTEYVYHQFQPWDYRTSSGELSNQHPNYNSFSIRSLLPLRSPGRRGSRKHLLQATLHCYFKSPPIPAQTQPVSLRAEFAYDLSHTSTYRPAALSFPPSLLHCCPTEFASQPNNSQLLELSHPGGLVLGQCAVSRGCFPNPKWSSSLRSFSIGLPPLCIDSRDTISTKGHTEKQGWRMAVVAVVGPISHRTDQSDTTSWWNDNFRVKTLDLPCFVLYHPFFCFVVTRDSLCWWQPVRGCVFRWHEKFSSERRPDLRWIELSYLWFYVWCGFNPTMCVHNWKVVRMPDSENGYHKKNYLILAATFVSSVGKIVRGTCKATKQKCGPKLVRLVSGRESRRFGQNTVRDRYETILTLPYTSTSVLFNHLGILPLLGCNKSISTKRVISYTNHENLRKAHWDVNMPSRATQPVGYEQIRAHQRHRATNMPSKKPRPDLNWDHASKICRCSWLK